MENTAEDAENAEEEEVCRRILAEKDDWA